MKSEKIKLRILGPLALAIGLIILATIIIYYRAIHADIESETTRNVRGIEKNYKSHLAHEVQKVSTILSAVMENRETREIFLSGDRDALLKEALPLFEKLRDRQEITHFYFIGTDRVCFLRVHNPDRHGDRIDRFTIIEAERTGEETWGLELGPLGTLTLRGVSPWFMGGELIGYLELGIEIEHIMEELSEMLGFDLYIFVHKEYLDRKGWEEGMDMLGRSSKWEHFPDTVNIGKALNETKGYISSAMAMKHKPGSVLPVDISRKGRQHHIEFIPLTDASGREIGHISYLRDITARLDSLHRAVMGAALTSLAAGAVIFTLFYIMLGGIERELEASHRGLAESERKYRELVDNAPVGVYKSTTGGEILYVNEALVRMMGFSSLDEMAEQGSIARYKDLAAREEFIRRLRGNGNVIGFEAELSTKEGETRYAVLNATLDGEVVSGMIMDITERRRAEEKLKQVHEELSKKTERLERFQRITLGREERIMELKGEVNELLERIGEAKRYEAAKT